MINNYTKARIYTSDKVFIGNANVTGKYGDKQVLMMVPEDVLKKMYTSFIITLYNDAYGLITYKGELVEYKKTLNKDEETVFDVTIELLDTLDIVQRRGNVKMKVTMPVTISLIDLLGSPILEERTGNPIQHSATIKDISASGVLITMNGNLEVGQRFDFLFNKAAAPFLITAEILRVQDYDDGLKGYGCKFYNVSAAKETIVRQYVFKLQLLEQKTGL